MNKLNERKFFDILFIIYFSGILIHLFELLTSLRNYDFINFGILFIWIIWFLITAFLWIKILIIQAKIKRWGWFIATIFVGAFAMPIFYFLGYRKYLSGREKLEDILV